MYRPQIRFIVIAENEGLRGRVAQSMWNSAIEERSSRRAEYRLFWIRLTWLLVDVSLAAVLDVWDGRWRKEVEGDAVYGMSHSQSKVMEIWCHKVSSHASLVESMHE